MSESEALYRRILSAMPREPHVLGNLGIVLASQGKYDEAVSAYRRAIAAKPQYADAYSNLGTALTEMGKFDEAVSAYRRAITFKPHYAEAHAGIGAALAKQGKLDEAIAAFRQSIAITPHYADAHFNLGSALAEQGKLEAAAMAYRQAIATRPHYAEAHAGLGAALIKQGKFEEAILAYRQAIAVKPDYTEARFSLFGALYQISLVNADLARAVALHLVDSLPNDGVLRRGVGGIAGIQFSADAEKRYTTDLFDQFAGKFDASLGRLGYDMPEKLARAAVGDQGGGDLDILDAGCGTGLCGVHVRARARRLVGVDLSANMLAMARAKGLYDALEQGDLVSFMENNAARFDLVLAADVLIYIGDVVPLARAAFLALRPGGVCAVSVESVDDEDGPPFTLSPTGRYRHTAKYMRETFSLAGFALAPLERTVVRLENTLPVPAWIVVGRKGG